MVDRARSLTFKPFVPKSAGQATSESKRTRPHVPESQRKRVRQACQNCRQKKDKCDGNVPCWRCSREGVVCELGVAPGALMSKAERTERLEKVVRHVLGVTSLDDEELRAMSDSIGRSEAPNPGERQLGAQSSLLNFSQQLERKLVDAQKSHQQMEDDNEDDVQNEDDAIATFCRSPSPVATPGDRFFTSVQAILPPRDVASHLVRVCFDYVQCNSFYAQETWVYKQLDALYGDASTLSERDIPTVATVLMIMALGTQFTSDLSLDHQGIVLYERTTSILPVLIKRSNFESVRACLLLATYLFPVDLSGLAYTYLGLAIHMATRNNMHINCHGEVELRVWWTLYTFYQRARIFHGRPATLSIAEVGVHRPRFLPELEPTSNVSNFSNQLILIEITVVLEKIADEIAQLRKHWNAVHIANLLALRKSLIDTKHSLPSLDPEGREEVSTARLRLDIHLCLFYWHARLFLGRPFFLDHPTAIRTTQAAQEPTLDKHVAAGELLAQDSADAAVNIIQLCNLIYNKIGLARASYATEFTSCRAAMLVLIAKGISDKSTALGELLDQGLTLIQHMALGQNQASSEARVIVALQRAITRLHRKPHIVTSSNDGLHDTLSHDHLRQWELLWEQPSPAGQSNDVEPSIEAAYAQQDTGKEYSATDPLDQNGHNPFESDLDDLWSTIFNSQLNEFNLVNCADGGLAVPQLDHQIDTGARPMYDNTPQRSSGLEPDADAQH
ncbi:uncharacterized protein K460DRAFT_405331 [Cucurbitaria berberidis CBS 394.84]|uniref:Zn(2)-C6 fungal-type domain-containing protein n=1 Tax=Cucurbitaria berberidis CBS 394.84 TaxID=1168544 RepID=A0A9P4GFE5_9PLEO|nr:uncharacterized protein K460DRAFT_405331 [Cucurbitaria berberidis CBS 394.84]KAF1845053.1 hypothetical protein K460DRAFT_405331 [Cucurbitaria berberidis CBS 394.84]